MCSFSEEMFLCDYFAFDAVVGKFCDAKAIFNCLAQSYYIDSERADALYALVTSKQVCNVTTLNDYKQYRRLCQYFQTCRIETSTSSVEDDVLAIKGKALYMINDCQLVGSDSNTKATIYANIVEKAKAGQVTALRLYGVLQCEGIFFEKRLRNGMKNLTRAARWNSIESILELLKYDSANSKTYTDMLYTLAIGTPYEEISAKAQKYYGMKNPQIIKECVLLSKVFGRGQIKPNVYLPVYANLLYSEIVPFGDKEKLLLSEKQEARAAYMDLPLKLTMRDFDYDVSAVTALSLVREEEQNRIIRNALNSDMRHLSTFKPLCLCSDSRFMRNYYASVITNLFRNAHVERISVADLCSYDFEPTMNNVFLRSCNEDKDNVYILSFVGEINEAAAKLACDFLQAAKRGKMRLVRPNIEINLGAVLPICFCDKNNAPTLARYCEKVEIATPNQEERFALLQGLIVEKKQQYGIDDLVVEERVMNKLCASSIDAAEAALDRAIAANRSGEQVLTLTEENASDCIKTPGEGRVYGYGGSKDAN